ncbi:50S ribosomal protein L16 [Candidatus Woesearchaeota archaeon]|nr:50S ribosomal protein L16 [Candidatus Woesearchaeota archaeon]
MAKLRKFNAYRRLERPYTRVSKYRKKNFVKSNPAITIARFVMGEQRTDYQYTLNLLSKEDLQIRANAFESARQTSNKLMEDALGKAGYFIQIRKYPHHILRENPLASGAGADRMSTGMAGAYGNPIGHAAQVRRGNPLFTVKVNKQNLELAKKALHRAAYKLPKSCFIEIIENKY